MVLRKQPMGPRLWRKFVISDCSFRHFSDGMCWCKLCITLVAICCCLLPSDAKDYLPSLKDRTLIGWGGEKTTMLRGASNSAPDGAWAESLGFKPRTMLYHGFISDEECEHVKALAAPSMERTATLDPQTNVEIRRSWIATVPFGDDDVLGRIRQKISQLVMLPTANDEPLKVLHYETGDFYSPHTDSIPDQDQDSSANVHISVFLYLSTPERGGELVFPNAKVAEQARGPEWTPCGSAGLGVRPRKGDMLLLYDLAPDLKSDPYALHKSCPVEVGDKWVASLWVHVNSYEGRVPVYRPQAKVASKSSPLAVAADACADKDEMCHEWAEDGECLGNPSYMVGVGTVPGSCYASCAAVDPDSLKAASVDCRNPGG